MQNALTCAEESRAEEEMLAGTFKPTDTFFLIECSLADDGGWRHETVKSAAKSGKFSAILRYLSALPRTKTLFIRRPGRTGKHVFIARTNQAQPQLFQTQLTDYAELLSLDMAGLAAGDSPVINGRAMTEIDELYAVCTNGRHDPCCAAYGSPVYQQLVAHAGEDRVWQTTHLGGHRMAATLLAFPQGVAYGHINPTDAEAIVTNHRAGYLLTHKYRGRGAYAGHRLDNESHQAVGAAEALIRELTRKYRMDELQLHGVHALEDGGRRVHFVDVGGAVYTAAVRTSLSLPRQTSCGEPPKPMPRHEVSLYAEA
ncbi:MAG: hypothetical protein OXE46_10130 [Chloroflexi bacterium]|nr:hypothetical protein [Chloroflexota bacterium]